MRPLTVLLLLAVPALGAETFLVCAGVEAYDDPGISPLQYAVADVTAVADAFRAAGVPPANITLLTTSAADRLERPTKFAVLHALQICRAKATAEDTLVFFFAGHGMQQAGEPYLLTSDSLREELQGTALPMGMVHAIMRGVQARNVLFIVDACRNDPDAGRAQADATLEEGLARGLRPRLEQGGPAPNAALLLACDVGQRAWEMPEAGHGAFTNFLLKGLAGEARDERGDVTSRSLAGYVTRAVPAWAQRSRREQTPRFESTGDGDFVLLGPSIVKPIALPAALEVASDPPGAMVTVDGRALGLTPLRHEFDLADQRAQRVTVRLDLADHAAEAAELELRAGATVSWLGVRLTRLDGAPAPADDAAQRPELWPEYLAHYQPPPGLGWSSYRLAPVDLMPQVLIPAGEFGMGATPEQARRALALADLEPWQLEDEQPPRRIHVSAFWMDLHEVTVEQYETFCTETERSHHEDWEELNPEPGHPVQWVSWEDAMAYAAWVGRRLPTEAEWEKAARGGSETLFPWGDRYDAYLAHGPERMFGMNFTAPVGWHRPNAYGLVDMIGNVTEWCRDTYDGEWYQRMPDRDPVNLDDDSFAVLRGGCWANSPEAMRSASRFFGLRDEPELHGGFRCVQSP